MVIVIAKTYEQYIHCCHQACLNQKEVPFINRVEQINALRGSVEPIFFGDYWNNPAYPDIERAMKARGIKVKGKYVR